MLFRNVTAGERLQGPTRFHERDLRPADGADDPVGAASTDVYNQTIPPDGYGYMTTRDGTKLAYSVHPPTDVIERRGLRPAADASPARSATASRPRPWSSTRATATRTRPGPESGIAALANLMGFTVVDVNMRGTGCSGGAFDFFEPLQNLDGYDVDRDGRPPALGRAQQGRDDGHLLRRHQPALHRPDPAAGAWPRSRRSR